MKRIFFALSMMGSKMISLIGIFIFAKFLTIDQIDLFSKYQSIYQLLIPIVSIQIPASIFRFAKEEKYKSTVNYIAKYSHYLYPIITLLVFLGLTISYIYVIFAAVLSNFVYQINLERVRALSIESDFYKCNFLFFLVYISIAIFFVYSQNNYIYLFVADILSSLIVVLVCKLLMRKNNELEIEFVYERFAIMCKYSIPLVSNALLWWFSTSGAVLISSLILGGESSAIVNINAKSALMVSTFAFIISSIYQRVMLDFYQKDRVSFYKRFDSYVVISLIVLMFISVLSYISFYEIIIRFYPDYYVSDFLIFINVLSGLMYGACAILGLMYICEKNTATAMISVIAGIVMTSITLFLMPKKYGIEGITISFSIGFLTNLLVRSWHYILFRNKNEKKYN